MAHYKYVDEIWDHPEEVGMYEIWLQRFPCCYPYFLENKNLDLDSKKCLSLRKNMWLMQLKDDRKNRRKEDDNSPPVVVVVGEGLFVVVKWGKLMALQLHASSWLATN